MVRTIVHMYNTILEGVGVLLVVVLNLECDLDDTAPRTYAISRFNIDNKEVGHLSS